MADDYIKCLNKIEITSNFIEKEIDNMYSELSHDIKRIKECNNTGIDKMQQIKNKFANGLKVFKFSKEDICNNSDIIEQKVINWLIFILVDERFFHVE